jgi:alcohol dehydrogenase (cytochrome c)
VFFFRSIACVSVAAVLISAPTLARQSATPITLADLELGLENPSRWLTMHGDYTGQRHSPIERITPENVDRLRPAWTFQSPGMTLSRGWEASPLFVDGTLYVTGNNNIAWAIDAATGRAIWTYRRELPNDLTYASGNRTNRGLAILGDRLFMTTLDAHVVALDRRTGQLIWDVPFADYTVGFAAIAAPLVVKDLVIVGNSGGDYPTRGFIDAFDAETGERRWRFYTIPAPGEPGSETWSDEEVMARGGGATWATGTYDPELNLVYWGTGNPNPDYYGGDRRGDNLYTASLVALDADTGELAWYFQFTPHDLHDWDATQIPVLAELEFEGQMRPVVMMANRNGFFYTLDRRSGELLVGRPFTGTQWARELDAAGRPIVLNDGYLEQGQPTEGETCVPDLRGGTNFYPPSYDPERELFFVMARESCAFYIARDDPAPSEPAVFMSGVMRQQPEPSYSALRALDPRTGEVRWEYRIGDLNQAGVLSTASGLVFAGNIEGDFAAFDSESGERLWSYYMGSPIHGTAAMTYELDGEQYVLIPSGVVLHAFALGD